MNCTGDTCGVESIIETASKTREEAAAKRKLDDWLRNLEPMDIDAYGSRVREQGV